MIELNVSATVELDLGYCDTSDVEVHVNGSSADYSGEVREEIDCLDVTTYASDIAAQLSSSQSHVLLGYIFSNYPDLKDAPDIAEIGVDDLYDGMTAAQRAHLFNKLLKYGDYNAMSVSLSRIGAMLTVIDEVRNGAATEATETGTITNPIKLDPV